LNPYFPLVFPLWDGEAPVLLTVVAKNGRERIDIEILVVILLTSRRYQDWPGI
jgi:hypothetical protein